MTRFGAYLPTYCATGPITPEGVASVAVRAEELGYDHVWVGDHYLWRIGMLAPLPSLAFVAARTSRVELGTAVYLTNLRHPTLTAKDVATVDVLSGGRVILGAGLGGDDHREYEVVGAPYARRGQRMSEYLRAIRAQLDGSTDDFTAELVQVPGYRLDPLPHRRPLPIWVGGRADASVRRAARLGDGWLPVWVSPRRIAAALELVAEIRGGLDGFRVGLDVFTCLRPTREQAGASLAQHLGSAYGLDFENFERYAAFGTSEQVAEAIRPYIDAGVTDVLFNLAGDDVEGQLHLIASEVLGKLR